MKFIKMVTMIFIQLLLIILFLVLAFIINLESLTIENVNNNVVKPKVTEQIINVIKEKYSDIDYEKIEMLEKELLSNPNVDTLTKTYIQNIINNILSKTSSDNINITKDDIIKIVNQLELSDDQKQIILEEINEKKIETIYNKIEGEIENKISDNNIIYIKIYNLLISKIFRYCLIALIVLLCIIIILLSNYFMLNLGSIIIIASFILIFLLPNLIIKNDIIKNINITNVVKYGYLYFIIGAIFVIFHLIFMIIKGSKKCLQD